MAQNIRRALKGRCGFNAYKFWLKLPANEKITTMQVFGKSATYFAK